MQSYNMKAGLTRHLHQLLIVLMVFVVGDFGLESLCLCPQLLHELLCKLRNLLDLLCSVQNLRDTVVWSG